MKNEVMVHGYYLDLTKNICEVEVIPSIESDKLIKPVDKNYMYKFIYKNILTKATDINVLLKEETVLYKIHRPEDPILSVYEEFTNVLRRQNREHTKHINHNDHLIVKLYSHEKNTKKEGI